MKIKLQGKMILGITIILVSSSIVTMFLSMNMLLGSTDQSIERNLYNVGETVSQLPYVIDGLKLTPTTARMQDKILNIQENSADIDYIVVCDMNGTRYSHPNPELLGLPLVGGDDDRIKASSNRYISSANGTLGMGIRAFIPIFDYDQKTRLGYVAVGTLSASIQTTQRQLILSYVIYLFSGLVIGVIGAYVLARNIKQSLLGLEPDDLARLYRENKGMMEALHEGIIAIDKNGTVTLLNESAKELLSLNENSLGKDVNTVLPNSRLPIVAASGEAEYNQEQKVSGRVIITNRVPIFEKGKATGAIATFRDKTIMIQLAEQLTGVNQLVGSLRASTHDFMNKMHTILGLLELSEYNRAKEFILGIQQKQQDLNKRLFHNFRDPVIAGLILGKDNVCNEQGIQMFVSSDSSLGEIRDKEFIHTLVMIIGNLIDNAIESAKNCRAGKGCISLYVSQQESEVLLMVSDNGMGISDENKEMIFKQGFSTKGTGRGMGLYLVKQEVEKHGGNIEVISDVVQTIFSVRIPYEKDSDMEWRS